MGKHMSHPVFGGVPLLVIMVLGLPPLGGCAGGGGAPRLSQTETVALKKAAREANVLHEAISPAISTDPELTAYFQELGKRLVDAARKTESQRGTLDAVRVEFHLVNNPVVNAFSTGGEHVYVYDGLFLRCGSEEELAAAMAHALAHTTLRHLARKELPESEDAAVLASEIVKSPYTPEEESEADRTGFQTYARAGWDPPRFGDLFQRVGGRDYTLRARDPRKWADQLPGSAQSWRRSPVADDRTFVQLQQKAKASASSVAARGSGGGDRADKASVLLAALPNCFVAEQPEQAAARRRLQQMLPVPTSGTDRERGTGFGRPQRGGQ
jgi:predicted Zn-dependent protease